MPIFFLYWTIPWYNLSKKLCRKVAQDYEGSLAVRWCGIYMSYILHGYYTGGCVASKSFTPGSWPFSWLVYTQLHLCKHLQPKHLWPYFSANFCCNVRAL